MAVAAGLATLRLPTADGVRGAGRNAARPSAALAVDGADRGRRRAPGAVRRQPVLGVLRRRPGRDFAGAQAAATWRYTPFFHAMLDAGVYLPPSAFEAWFVNAAMDDAVLDRIAPALPAAAAAAAAAASATRPRMTARRPLTRRAPAAPRRGLQPRPRAVRPAARLPARPICGQAQAEAGGRVLGRRDDRLPGLRRRWSGPSRPRPRWPSWLGLDVAIDERLIEAANELEGRPVAGGKGLFTDPGNWKLLPQPAAAVVG